MRVMVITPDMQCEIREIENKLETLQEIVGGYIQVVHPQQVQAKGFCLIVDEEGLMKPYELNLIASGIYGSELVGTAILLGEKGEEFTDIPQKVEESVGRINKKLEPLIALLKQMKS